MAVARWVGGLVVMLWLVAAAPAAASVPPGFQESVAFDGLVQPTAVRFAPDGRVFVAEKAGRIQVFEDLDDPTPSLYADLSEDVHDYWDRGLLGLALDPGFSSGRPYVYVLYAYNKAPGSDQVPRWPDACPDPPGGTTDGCVVTGRLSRLGGGFEEVLIEDWCQQYPSHSIGSLAFGQDGALYVSGGDGASFDFTDWGQGGIPRNPCGDPPVPVGGVQTPGSSEGGALRSQDVRTTGDPTGLGGAILRVNPDTGAALPDNPNAGSSDPNARRIVAYGLRNPFRITIRPGTNEVWAADVGWRLWEEIDRLQNPTAGMVNFGWPCYEGNGRMADYDALDLGLCETLYQQGAAAHTQPFLAYPHQDFVVPGETCPWGASSISGVAFTPQVSSFPAAYDGALFFSDYSRNCIWAMKRNGGALPDPANVETFVAEAAGPAELQFGPGGDLFYVDIAGGTIRRIRWGDNETPVAHATATQSSGNPLAFSFDGSGSTDPGGGPLTYAWDLDGDGAFDDSTAVAPTRTYASPGPVTVRLRVTETGGLTDTDTLTITAGTPPTATINSPAPGTTWRVGQTLAFSGSAGGAVDLSWKVNLRHCDRSNGTCHTHTLQSFNGASGTFPAPDHSFPSYLELELTARDANGLTRTVTRRLDPRIVDLTLASRPAGVQISFGGETAPAPFTREVIEGSTNTVGAASPQTLLGAPHAFVAWSDGLARNHTTVIGADTTLTVTFARSTAHRLAGADWIGPAHPASVANPGTAEVYRTVADHSGSATELRLYVAPTSTASALVMGLYADENGEPGALLDSGRTELPAPGAWNKVDVDIPQIEAGRAYWIGILNPSDGSGDLRWRDRADASLSPELQSDPAGSLDEMPADWVTLNTYDGGPVSAYVFGPPPPGLEVSPGSLAFGGRSPVAQQVSVTDAAGGALPYTVSDDAAWLTVTPASGSAPDELTVAVDTGGLLPGVHRATVRVESARGTRLIPVTLTFEASPALPAPPSGPVGAWGFDEARGKRVHDASGTGNAGRISGAVRTRGRAATCSRAPSTPCAGRRCRCAAGRTSR